MAKKIDFEPRIPTEQEVLPIEKIEQIPDQKPQESAQQAMKGVFAPRTFASGKEFNLNSNEFIMNLPDFFSGDCTLVAFNDNTFGIRMNGIVYECDGLFQGDSMMIEMDDKVRKIGNPEFIMNAYPYEKV